MTDTTTPDAVPEPSRKALRSFDIANTLERFGLLLVWVVITLFFTIALPGTFFTQANLATIFGSQAVLVVLTFALLIPLTSGDYDLSTASVLTLSAMIVAILNVNMGVPLPLAVAAALLSGIAAGIVNGALIVLLRIESLIVTLGTGTIASGLVLLISESRTIYGIDPALVDLVIVPKVFGLPLGFFYGLGLCIAIWYLFEYTALGRQLLFVGRGRRVARLSGLPVGSLRWKSLLASGLISAGAGVLYAGTSGAADPTSGTSFLLPAFAAAFLGSTTIVPGRFNSWGSLFAVYFLVTGITGLALMGIQVYVQNLFYGGALIVAVALAQLVRRREMKDSEDE